MRPIPELLRRHGTDGGDSLGAATFLSHHRDRPFIRRGLTNSPLCRPAVMVSYAIAALAALLSGLAYAEFAVDLPVSGGATTCILLTFGELPSW